jgi:hypothetical protein
MPSKKNSQSAGHRGTEVLHKSPLQLYFGNARPQSLPLARVSALLISIRASADTPANVRLVHPFMTANLLQILILGLVQGAAELLPVSSSAHVIVAEKLLGLDPSAPEMTFLLVMLHTGTMFAVIVYFWKSWRASYFANWEAFRRILINVVVATIATGVVGLALQHLIESFF